jgi:hypothetical protein
MNLRDAFTQTTAHFMAGNAVTWISPPGTGKSAKRKDLLKWMRKTFPGQRLGTSTIFMATQTPLGFGGLPWKGVLEYNGKSYTITDPAIPQWFIAFDLETGKPAPADQFDRVLLVIEEWGQGDLETKRAGAEVFRAGGTGNFWLPKGSFRLALSNNDVRDGVTKEFDFVINGRAELHIGGDVDVWDEDFASRPQEDGRVIMPITRVWAKQNPTVPVEPKPKEQGPWCTYRSLTMWDGYAQAAAAQSGGTLPLDDPAFTEASAGTIGMPAAQLLLGACRFLVELPSLENVVADPMGTEVPSKPDLVMLMMYELASRVKPDQLEPVLQYITKKKPDGKPAFAQDMNVTFVMALLRRDYNLLEAPPVKAWVVKNQRLVSIIASLAQ